MTAWQHKEPAYLLGHEVFNAVRSTAMSRCGYKISREISSARVIILPVVPNVEMELSTKGLLGNNASKIKRKETRLERGKL